MGKRAITARVICKKEGWMESPILLGGGKKGAIKGKRDLAGVHRIGFKRAPRRHSAEKVDHLSTTN